MGKPPGWLLWKSLTFPQWRPVFSLGKFRGKVKEAIGLFTGGPSSDTARADNPVSQQGPWLRTFPSPVFQRCVGQFSIPKVTKQNKKTLEEEIFLKEEQFISTHFQQRGPETRPQITVKSGQWKTGRLRAADVMVDGGRKDTWRAQMSPVNG